MLTKHPAEHTCTGVAALLQFGQCHTEKEQRKTDENGNRANKSGNRQVGLRKDG